MEVVGLPLGKDRVGKASLFSQWISALRSVSTAAPHNELTVFIALPLAALSHTFSVHFCTAINSTNHTASQSPGTKAYFTFSYPEWLPVLQCFITHNDFIILFHRTSFELKKTFREYNALSTVVSCQSIFAYVHSSSNVFVQINSKGAVKILLSKHTLSMSPEPRTLSHHVLHHTSFSPFPSCGASHRHVKHRNVPSP